MTPRQKTESLLQSMSQGLFEKEEPLRLALLSALAGESIFLLGPPGVAKSMIARRLKLAFQDGKAFEYLLNRFSTPDEIFGPVSISKLKNEDKYERVVEGYLPAATVVFLDEIWKAGPSIQNALLTVLNERKYRNGAQEIDLPMQALISASNELPAEGQGLEALWDRFILRLVVEGIKDKEAFQQMITAGKDTEAPKANSNLAIAATEVTAWQAMAETVKVPDNVFQVIQLIRAKMAQHNEKKANAEDQFYVSDRRWRKIIRVLRTSAFLCGRTEVDLMDCCLIGHCLWNNEGQVNTAMEMVREAVETNGYKLSIDLKEITSTVAAFRKSVEKECKREKERAYEVPKVIDNQYYHVEGHSYPLINKQVFEGLNKSVQGVTLVNPNGNHWNNETHANAAKSPKPNHVIINNTEYKLRTDEKKETLIVTTAPHEDLKEAWDQKVDKLLQQITSLQEEIEAQRQKDGEGLRQALFVDLGYVEVVESHVKNTLHDLETLKVDLNSTKNHYHSVKDGQSVK